MGKKREMQDAEPGFPAETVNRKQQFADHYTAHGYQVRIEAGVLMFGGSYDIADIKHMLEEDGYIGRYGVAGK